MGKINGEYIKYCSLRITLAKLFRPVCHVFVYNYISPSFQLPIFLFIRLAAITNQTCQTSSVFELSNCDKFTLGI